MNPILLFGLVAAAMFAIVPLATWAGTGSRGQAYHSAKWYALALLIVVGVPAAIGVAVALAAHMAGISY